MAKKTRPFLRVRTENNIQSVFVVGTPQSPKLIRDRVQFSKEDTKEQKEAAVEAMLRRCFPYFYFD